MCTIKDLESKLFLGKLILWTSLLKYYLINQNKLLISNMYKYLEKLLTLDVDKGGCNNLFNTQDVKLNLMILCN
jgi:hypothetical protein